MKSSTGFKGIYAISDGMTELAREVVNASGEVYTRTANGQKPVCGYEPGVAGMQIYTAQTTTWRGASKLLRVPFDNVVYVTGQMAPTLVKAASLQARRPGVPVYIQGWRVTSNRSSTDKGATVAVIGRMANGARASAAAARRCVYKWFALGY